jgi:hypothetical protein
LTVPDGRTIGLTEGTKLRVSSVEVDVVGLGQVTVRAVNLFTWECVRSIAVVKTTEPHSAGVSSERPLTNPDGVLKVRDAPLSHVCTVVVTVRSDIGLGSLPSHVLVNVDDDVLHIIIGEQIIPLVSPGHE